jgi:hypothetical protein
MENPVCILLVLEISTALLETSNAATFRLQSNGFHVEFIIKWERHCFTNRLPVALNEGLAAVKVLQVLAERP